MAKLIVMMGIPGAGKSTAAKKIAIAYEATYVSMDDIRKVLCGDAQDQSKNNEVYGIAMREIRASLDAGINVVYDATNRHFRDRFAIATQFKDKADDMFLVFVNTDPDVAWERNCARDRVVPRKAFDRMVKQLQEPGEKDEALGYKVIRRYAEENGYED